MANPDDEYRCGDGTAHVYIENDAADHVTFYINDRIDADSAGESAALSDSFDALVRAVSLEVGRPVTKICSGSEGGWSVGQLVDSFEALAKSAVAALGPRPRTKRTPSLSLRWNLPQGGDFLVDA
ncbi:hypothetical protein ABZ540_35645 [Nocardia xishanensis]|uniref:hypothetical protein n=1 Tax=Nocardia xishanensis TaxID=238964 RepID=UPI0033EA690F